MMHWYIGVDGTCAPWYCSRKLGRRSSTKLPMKFTRSSWRRDVITWLSRLHPPQTSVSNAGFSASWIVAYLRVHVYIQRQPLTKLNFYLLNTTVSAANSSGTDTTGFQKEIYTHDRAALKLTPVDTERVENWNELQAHYYLCRRRRLCFHFGLFVCLSVG